MLLQEVLNMLAIGLVGIALNLVVPILKHFEMGFYINPNINDDEFLAREKELSALTKMVYEKHGSKTTWILMLIPYSSILDWLLSMYFLRKYLAKNPQKDMIDYMMEMRHQMLENPCNRYVVS